MAWIKRNLYFVIGALAALALMIAGAFYLFAQISKEGELTEKIKAQYAELQRLISQNPHPGYGQIDNIKAAKAEAAAIRAYVTKARTMFERIPSIPDGSENKIGNAEFNTGLRNTISELHHSAQQQAVFVAKDYYFTFESQRKSVIFDPASLSKVAVQLGEVKALCDILFSARINQLDHIRREAVSADDKTQADYVTGKSVTTPLAEISPYEVKFRCFSPELAVVMAKLASSPYGFVVKTINVEPTSPTGEQAAPQIDPTSGNAVPQIPNRRNGLPAPGTPQVTPAVDTRSVKGGPQKLLAEKPFTVTLLIDVVKLKPEEGKPGKR